MFISVLFVGVVTDHYAPIHTCASWLNMPNSCENGFVRPNHPKRSTCTAECDHAQCCGRCREDIHCSSRGSVSEANGTCVCECYSGYAGGDCSLVVSRQVATGTDFAGPSCTRPEHVLEWYARKWWCTSAVAAGVCGRMPLSPGYLHGHLVASQNEADCIARCRDKLTPCRAAGWIGVVLYRGKNCMHYSGNAYIGSVPGLHGARCYLMGPYTPPIGSGNGCLPAGSRDDTKCGTYRHKAQYETQEVVISWVFASRLVVKRRTVKHVFTTVYSKKRLRVGSRCCNLEQSRCASFCTRSDQAYLHTCEEAENSCRKRGLTLCSRDMLRKESYRGGCVGSGCGYDERKIYVRSLCV